MKIKTSKLIGPALNWAVATCEGYTDLRRNPHRFNDDLIMTPPRAGYGPVLLVDLAYSTDWIQGGPIIEREGINTFKHNKLDDREPDRWCAHKVVPRPNLEGGFNMVAVAPDGPTPLIAAMRCYVASKLGDEVEIPEELDIMNLQPMRPDPLAGSGEVFTVLCCKCGKAVKSNDVYCDMDGKFGDFYCDACALKVEVLAEH